jgi:hypothetical protein
MDYVGKSDPYCEVHVKNDERSEWVKIGKTDTLINNLNPDFTTPITVHYYFEKIQQIKFKVYDKDGEGGKKQGIGKHETTIAELIGAKNQTYSNDLKDKKSKRGKIIVRTDSVNESNKVVVMRVKCDGLKSKTSMFSSHNHPYLAIKRCLSQDDTDPENTVIVWSSEVIEDTLKPTWKMCEFKLENLCNSNIDLPLIFEVWSFNEDEEDRIYGRVTSTVRKLIDQQGEDMDIIKKQGTAFGTMNFIKFELIERPTMMDYLRSGWIVSLCVAVDWTASNGNLQEPTSLHYIDPDEPLMMTQYENAISQVGKILEPYDADKLFPVYGFGAKPRHIGRDDVSHCFHLNGQDNPCALGVAGILELYRYDIYFPTKYFYFLNYYFIKLH